MDAIVIEPCVSVRGCVLRTGSLGLDGGDVCGDSISPPQHFTRKEPFALICVIISVSPPCPL
jgi:hypothetical protein